jgi:RimJ/RimL family protein N-acetyltransferase
MGRPVLGTPEIIRRLSREAVVAYLRDHYAPAHGAVGLRQSRPRPHRRAAEKLLSALPAERRSRPSRRAMSAATIARSAISSSCTSCSAFPGIPLGDPDYYAASVLSTAFGGGMSSRLFQEVREKRGLVYAIHSFAHSYRDGGLFGIYAGTGEEEAAELVPVLCDETMRLGDGLGAGELARAKAQMKAGLLMSLESTSARCEQMAQHMLIHGTPFDRPRSSRIEAVDDAAIARVVARWRGATADPGRARAARPARGFRPAARPARRLTERSTATGDGRRASQILSRLFLGRSGAAAAGRRRVFLRPPERGDYEAWAACAANRARLSDALGADLAADALSRASFRSRLARYAEDWRTDQGYNFFIFRQEDDALAGGIGLSNVRRGVAETGEPRLLDRRALRAPALYDGGAAAGARFRLHRLRLHRVEAACLPSNVPSRACCCAPASSRRATPAATC